MKALAAAFLLALLFLPRAPCAQEPQDILVVYTEWPPYTFTREGAPVGFEVEIVRAVFESLGRRVVFQPYPWNRCLAMLRAGQATALVSLLQTPERQEYVRFPEEHLSESRTVLAVRADSAIRYSGDLRELAPYSVGVFSGFSYGKAFDEASFLTREPAKDTDQLLNKLVRGRNDLIAENEAVLAYTAARLGLADAIRFLEPPVHTQRLYVGFTRAADTTDLAAEFSARLREFKGTPAYRRILDKYHVR